MPSYAVVTGGGSGIGAALAHQLARRGLHVVIVGRREGPLEDVRSAAPDRITACAADVAEPDGRRHIAAALPPDARLAALVHNAALLEPVGPLAEVELEAWRYHQRVNVEAPLFLTQALLPRLRGGRVLHLSSGAAHKPYEGWGAYCTSKAALHMIYQVLRLELAAHEVAVGSARPGVVDTPMQSHIRGIPEARFPHRARFVRLKAEGNLLPPEHAAAFLERLLLDVDADTFSSKEWDVRDQD